MPLKLELLGLYTVSLLGRTAADGHLVTQVNWRACEGYATSLKYITGTNVSYTPGWASGAVRETSELLDAGKSSDSELEAACDALLEEGQVGEIYTMKAENCDGKTDCLRMAVYATTEDGLLVGYEANPKDQATWVCGYGVPPPPKPECPTPSPSAPAPSTLQAQSKWRPCDGYATNIMYVTGTGVDYSPSWAAATSKNELLDAGKMSDTDLQAACDALLSEGQVGEIYTMKAENCDGKTDCLRMAIYPATEDGLLVGTVANPGDQATWVCGKDAMPPAQPPCPPTCGEVKEAYKASKCCGNPTAMFKMDGMRRLAPSKTSEDSSAILARLDKELKRAKSESPAKADRLAQQVHNLLKDYV